MNFMGMEKMIQSFIKTALRDPKKRKFVEEALVNTADVSLLQKYVNMRLYGVAFKEGELINLDEGGDIPKILERLDRLEKQQEEILKLLQKVVGEE